MLVSHIKNVNFGFGIVKGLLKIIRHRSKK